MCCAFQTLESTGLDTFLPSDSHKSWAGLHLNVVLPLWQQLLHKDKDFSVDDLDRVSFAQYLFSDDQALRKRAESLRDSFNALCDSPSSKLRSYHFAQQRIKMNGLLPGKSQFRKFEKYTAFLENGFHTTARDFRRSEPSFAFGDFNFSIRKILDSQVKVDDDIWVRPFLTKHAHPKRYARRETATDPASRLLIRLTSSKWQGWLYSEGNKKVMKMNIFVDILENVPIQNSKLLKGRWTRIPNRKTMYT